jgi:hypothetical protein
VEILKHILGLGWWKIKQCTRYVSVCSVETAVEHLPRWQRFNGLSPATIAGPGGENMEKTYWFYNSYIVLTNGVGDSDDGEQEVGILHRYSLQDGHVGQVDEGYVEAEHAEDVADGDQQEERLAQDFVVDHLLQNVYHRRHTFMLVTEDALEKEKYLRWLSWNGTLGTTVVQTAKLPFTWRHLAVNVLIYI